MTFTTVDSRRIATVGFDDATHDLEVTFRNGKVYRWQGVPKHLADALVSSGKTSVLRIVENYCGRRHRPGRNR